MQVMKLQSVATVTWKYGNDKAVKGALSHNSSRVSENSKTYTKILVLVSSFQAFGLKCNEVRKNERYKCGNTVTFSLSLKFREVFSAKYVNFTWHLLTAQLL